MSIKALEEGGDAGSLQLPLTCELIRQQIERILASKSFDASERNRSFLQYVVDETLKGRASYIKGYTVARSVFGRDPDFDPQLDPVVRIEASRLRRSLERYYLTAGKGDLVLVELPKGGYVPRFELNPQATPEPQPLALSSGVDEAVGRAQVRSALGPTIITSRFENLSGDLACELLSCGIGEELDGPLQAWSRVGELRQLVSGFRIPKLDEGSLPIPGGEQLAVRAEVDDLAEAGQQPVSRPDPLPRDRIPHANGFVFGHGGQPRAVATEGKSRDRG